MICLSTLSPLELGSLAMVIPANVSSVAYAYPIGLLLSQLQLLYRAFSRVVTDHVLLQYVLVTFRLCPFLPTMRGRLDWYVIQRSQKQELLGTYAFSISTIAVSQFSGGTDRVNLPCRLRVRE